MSGQDDGDIDDLPPLDVTHTRARDALIADWDLRPWVLGGLLALAGLGIHFLTHEQYDSEPWRMALVTFLGFGAVGAAFTLDPGKWRSAPLFALVIGLVMGGIAYHVARTESQIVGGEFMFAAAVIFALLALPLFQAGFLRTRFATDYRTTHFHVWADAISGAGALAFVGLSWLMLFMLDQLFGLLGIELIGDAMEEGWFAWMWSAGAFGAALGVLRENLKIIGALQNVVMLVFALLAVPLAAALVVFIVLLMASGGAALWDATDSATPILLACAAGGFVLANAIIRDDDEAKSKNRIMQIAAAVLAAMILPLVVFAAIGMGLRIDQRGLSPERIWALIAIAVAAAYGVAAWVALARGRRAGWSAALRQANLHLAAVVCAVALIVALPFWDFGAVAARNQVARLESGKTPLAEFDFTALRWDFGASGRAVLARLAAGEGEQAELAARAKAQTERPWYTPDEAQAGFTGELRVELADPALDALVRAHLDANPWACSDYCVAVDLGLAADGRREVALVQRHGYERIALGDAKIAPDVPAQTAATEWTELQDDSRVEIRAEQVRYIYVDGRRMGPPLEETEPRAPIVRSMRIDSGEIREKPPVPSE